MRKSLKAFLSRLLAVLMLVTAIPFAVFAEMRMETPQEPAREQTLLGDADQDGTIGIGDAIMIARHVLGLTTVISTCDINRDGIITIADSILAARCAMHLIEWVYDIEISYTRPADGHTLLDEETNTYYVDNQMLVVGHEGVTKAQIAELFSSYNGEIVGYIELTDDFQIQFPQEYSLSQLESIAAQLEANAFVDDALPHIMLPTNFCEDTKTAETFVTPNDWKWLWEEWSTDFPEGSNWGVEAIQCPEAWWFYHQNMIDTHRTRVGILDSMFDTNHEDLKDSFVRVWNNPSNINDESDERNRTHGTHVAGTIGAGYNNWKGIAGVAPEVDLYAYSINGSVTDAFVKNNRLLGYFETIYALANLISNNCRVINVSMGYAEQYQKELDNGTSRDALNSALDNQANYYEAFLAKLLDHGYDFLIVQSAGNDMDLDTMCNGLFVRIDEPAVMERIIVVGGLHNRGSHHNGWIFGERVFDGYEYTYNNGNSGFCFGDRVDVAAPGVSIYSTLPNNKYGYKSGTSMAAPHVSGIAAMCFSVNPSINGSQVKKIITNDLREINPDSSSALDSFPSLTHTVNIDGEEHAFSYTVPSALGCVLVAFLIGGETIEPSNPSTGIIVGQVLDWDTSAGLPQTAVSVFYVSDNNPNDITFAGSTVTDAYGGYTLILEPGEYLLSVSHEGYFPHAKLDVSVIANQTTYINNIYLMPEEDLNCSITGTVSDALNGNAIANAQIKLRPGWGNKDGEIASDLSGHQAITTTNASGQYSINMPHFCYTAEIIKDGYLTEYVDIISLTQNATLTPVLASGEYRIVLTWGAEPRDLDSHVEGTLTNGNSFHVYFSDKIQNDGSITVCELDHDDIDGYGPETITLRPIDSCSYYYYIKRYNGSGSISTSGAQVKIYSGSTLLWTFNAPTNQGAGDYWNVLALVDGRPVIKNTITDSPDVGYHN